ncbi:VTT domain-containing protein [Rhodoferax sp. GW822-FHT02A01]|uniref:TVP38/TMEM64 family protein n=1 Tax=Rhodoferax sp. GW822-FHT02A01 TaxID=3141537 RepID=UPI00315DA37D
MSARHIRHKLVLAVAVVLLVVVCALAWSFSPLREALDVPRVVTSLRQIAQHFGLVAAVLAFALALIVAVPLTFLTVVFIVALGSLNGFLCVMLGAQLGALCSYGLGAALGRDILRKLGGERANRLSQKLGERGLLAIIAVRMVPVAPFAVINMVAGASHIRLADLLLGTFLGMAPGTLAIALFIEKVLDAIQNPGRTSWLVVVVLLLAIGAGVWAIRAWWRRALRH